MHDLQYSSNSADGVVDGDSADEFCGQVGVENQLYLLRAANQFKRPMKSHIWENKELVNYKVSMMQQRQFV